ncbi:MAG: 4Fe-4S dicluster domain-containing protein [Spirochaetota bacterium]|nr:4Fe-4S dicluster domain-containing protein [Spirochaetota bacterium]
MSQIGFLIDVSKCIACNSCRVACQIHNNIGYNIAWREVSIYEDGEFPNVNQYSISLSCNHCLDPACMKVCPVNAVIKRNKDGIVYIDDKLCNGCERCIGACPYGAPKKGYLENKITKCHFCKDRQDNREIPVCVETCLGGALQYGLLIDMEKIAGKRGIIRQIEGFRDPSFTNPSTRFVKPLK